MSLNKLIIDYINWLRSLTRKIVRHARWRFVSSVFLFLVNQISMLLAFFLPLKVIIMLGTEGVPRYLRFFVDESNKDQMIAWLAGATVGFYLLGMLSEHLMKKSAEAASARIMANAKKAALFDQQEAFAEDVFQRVTQSWGAYLMILLGFVIGFTLEYRVFVVLIVVIVLEYLGFYYWWEHCRRIENLHARINFQKQHDSVVDIAFAINFFVVFGMLVYLFLFDETLNFIIGILLILLARRVFQRVKPLVSDATYLVNHRTKIQALYFTHARLEKKENYIEQGFYQMLMPERRQEIFEPLLSQVFSDSERENLHFEWVDCGLNNVAAFKGTFPADKENRESFWLKCYAPNRQNYFHQEKFIAENAAQFNGLVPELLYCDEYQGMFLSLFKTDGAVPVPKKRFKQLAKETRMKMWLAQPSSQVFNSFERSMQPLERRLSADKLKILHIACRTDKEIGLLDQLESGWEEIQKEVHEVPLCVINRGISPNNLFLDHDNRPFLLNWAAVGFDHIGADLGVNPAQQRYDFESAAESIRASRLDADSLTARQLELVACLADMEKDINKQFYRAALEKVRHVLKLIDTDDADVGRISAKGA